MLLNVAIVCGVIALIFRLGNESVRFHLYFVTVVALVNTIALFMLPFAVLFPKNLFIMRFATSVMDNVASEILDINFRVEGDLANLDVKGIVVANHQSAIDLIGLHSLYSKVTRCLGRRDWGMTIMSTRELLYFPYGIFYWIVGRLLVFNRQSGKSRENVQKEASKSLQNNRTLIIYPEGHRNKSHKGLMPFKKGAFRLAIANQVPIIPVVYSPFVFIDRINKTMTRGDIILSVLNPIPTTGLTLKDLDQITDKVFKLMSEEYEKLRNRVTSSCHGYSKYENGLKSEH